MKSICTIILVFCIQTLGLAQSELIFVKASDTLQKDIVYVPDSVINDGYSLQQNGRAYLGDSVLVGIEGYISYEDVFMVVYEVNKKFLVFNEQNQKNETVTSVERSVPYVPYVMMILILLFFLVVRYMFSVAANKESETITIATILRTTSSAMLAITLTVATVAIAVVLGVGVVIEVAAAVGAAVALVTIVVFCITADVMLFKSKNLIQIFFNISILSYLILCFLFGTLIFLVPCILGILLGHVLFLFVQRIKKRRAVSTA